MSVPQAGSRVFYRSRAWLAWLFILSLAVSGLAMALWISGMARLLTLQILFGAGGGAGLIALIGLLLPRKPLLILYEWGLRNGREVFWADVQDVVIGFHPMSRQWQVSLRLRNETEEVISISGLSASPGIVYQEISTRRSAASRVIKR